MRSEIDQWTGTHTSNITPGIKNQLNKLRGNQGFGGRFVKTGAMQYLGPAHNSHTRVRGDQEKPEMVDDLWGGDEE